MAPAPTRPKRIRGEWLLFMVGLLRFAQGGHGVVQSGSDEIEVFVGIALRPGEYENAVECGQRAGEMFLAVVHRLRPRQREGITAIAEGALLGEDFAAKCRLLNVARRARDASVSQQLAHGHGTATSIISQLVPIDIQTVLPE